MTRLNSFTPIWKVVIVERERGWGQREEDRIYFDNEEEACDYVKKYNADPNRGDSECYWAAEGPYKLS